MIRDRVIRAVIGLLLSYVVLLIGPDVRRLARRLAVDSTVPGRSRILLVGLVLYLAGIRRRPPHDVRARGPRQQR